jgi:death on curing protein
MKEPTFLSREDVELIHAAAIAEFGGALGLRDETVLESALAQPMHEHFYRNADTFQIAAAYAFHIAQNQPFVDGNKRAALLAALNFLVLNGVESNEPVDELYDAMIGIAEKRLDKAALAAVFRQQLSR